MKTIKFLVAGVGGQGTLLVSNVLAEVGFQAGFDVKKTEIHGMSQRGGSVTSDVCWGERVYSPVIGRGEADYLLALEKLEVLRYLQMVRPGGVILVGDSKIAPLSVTSGDDHYPSDDEIQQALCQVTERYYFAPTIEIATSLGNGRVHNAVLLGALSKLVEGVDRQVWLEVLKQRVPAKHKELNQEAFLAGAA